jgi:tetratricopeptide (TPR) repeat protein
VDSPITLGPGNNKILATVLLTLMKIYGSPRHVELARARLDELWAIDDRKLENAGGYKARACGILLNHYKDLQDFNKAKNMYTHMANLDFDHDTILERFYSTIDIIIHQAANGDPVMALNLYNPLSHLKKFREYNYQRVKAGAALTTAFAEQGMLEEAQGLFDLLATLEVSRGLDMDDLSKDPLGLVRAGVDLARTHERDLFHHENGKEGADLAILHRAECALALMEAYAERYDVNSVKMIHDSLKLPNPNLDFTQAIASLSFGLFKTYLRVGDVSSALEYYLDELENELPFDEGNFLRCTMACHLMLAESGEKGLNLALRIYHGCRFVGDGPYAKEARATVSGLMVRILSSRGSTLKKAHEVFSSDRFFRDTEGFQEVRAKGALGLADAFVRKGSFGKAKKLYETGLFAAAALDDLPLKLRVMGRLVKDSCLRGNLDFARKLFEDFPVTLPATLKKMAAHRVMASITLNRAYRDAGNKEGIEFMRDCFANFDKNELRLLRGFEKQGLIELRNVFPAGKGKKKPRNGKK